MVSAKIRVSIKKAQLINQNHQIKKNKSLLDKKKILKISLIFKGGIYYKSFQFQVLPCSCCRQYRFSHTPKNPKKQCQCHAR